LHIALNEKWNLSVGAGLSVSQTSLNRDKLNVDVKDDAGIGTGLNSKINPDLSAGAFLSSETFFVGYSANYILRNDIYSLSDKSTLVGKQKAHHYGTIGFRFDLSENWNLSPAAMIKYVDGSPLSTDVYCRFNYKELLWFGPSFRNQDSFSGFFGANLSNLLSLSYAYDYNYSSINTASNGSHEVILGLRLIKNGVKAPRPSMW
jgi:type IX secretion system PorP/SprF family membrane protein